MSEILLSICIPTFNRGESLKTTIRNILSQDLDRVEIIVSDNCSKDNTEKIVKEFNSNKIYYYRNSENYGGIYNLIKSLELSSGKFVTLLSDEDDIDINNVIFSILSNSFSKEPIIIGSVKSKTGQLYRSYRNKNYKPKFYTYFRYSFSLAYMSGIVFFRNKIDFEEIWTEYKSSESFGLLDVYPHLYIFNKLLLTSSLITTNRIFSCMRETAVSYVVPLDNNYYFEPAARFEQLKKNINFVNLFSPYNKIFNSFIRGKLLLGFLISLESFKNFGQEQIKYYLFLGSIHIDIRAFLMESITYLEEMKVISRLDLLNYRLYKFGRAIYKFIFK